ncbi:putative UBC5-E2 ubiquitin-conjugating enzyme [Phlyctochytrium arcticum]|nr:putative UBC5-E2 ubiquitin-conjugating enzyme [Phlyctochytrium arcticum]
MAALRRIQREMADLAKTPIPNATASPKDESTIMNWTGRLVAPEESAYKGGVFKITIDFPTDYPFKPPTVKFVTKIYHPNVDDDGSICLVLLKSEVWKPSTKLVDILTALVDLLQNPVPEDALQSSIAQIYNTDEAKFKKTVKEWIKKYCEKST